MAIYIDDLIGEKNKQFNYQYSDYYNLFDGWNQSLYKIGKSNKGFITKKGDIFLIQPIKGLYFYGKVLDVFNERKSKNNYFACCIIFNCKTTKISIDDFVENYNNVIGVTEKISLISSIFFQSGKIMVVGNTKIDDSVKYGFIETVGWRKIDDNIIDEKNIVKDDKLAFEIPQCYKAVCKYVNYNGDDLNYVPEFYCESLSYITEYGLLVLFYKEFFIDNELFNLNGFDFNIKSLCMKKTIKNNNVEILPFKCNKIKNKYYSVTLDVNEYASLFEDYPITGNGYDIEKIFMYFLNEKEYDAKSIITDSESEMFVVCCENKKFLFNIILDFKSYIENACNLSNAIKKIDFEN